MGITDNVKDLCLRYFDYLWHRWEGENVQGSGVLSILPEAMRASFAEATFHRLVRKVPLYTSFYFNVWYKSLEISAKICTFRQH